MSKEQLDKVVDSCIDMDMDVPLSAALIAKCAMDIIDPDSDSPVLVSYSANLYLRELARARLRGAFDPTQSKDNNQIEMFECLQDRYPVHREDDNGDVHIYYDKRMNLSYEERMFNLDRMKREITTKQKHYDALMAETMTLLDKGYFSKDGT